MRKEKPECMDETMHSGFCCDAAALWCCCQRRQADKSAIKVLLWWYSATVTLYLVRPAIVLRVRTRFLRNRSALPRRGIDKGKFPQVHDDKDYPVFVVDEDAKLTFPYKRLARRICLGPEAAMERSEKQKNMFEGECNSAPTTDREMIWRRSLSSFP